MKELEFFNFLMKICENLEIKIKKVYEFFINNFEGKLSSNDNLDKSIKKIKEFIEKNEKLINFDINSTYKLKKIKEN